MTNLRGAAYLGIFNTRRPPYDDPRVRRALAHAIDRSFIRNAVAGRFGLEMLGPLPPVNALYDRNLAMVGVRTTLQPLDRLALNQKGYVVGQFDMIAETYGLGPGPDMGVERFYNGGNIHTPGVPFTNTSGYADPAVDALFERQRVQTDPAARVGTASAAAVAGVGALGFRWWKRQAHRALP